MTFPSSSTSLAQAWISVQSTAKRIKTAAQDLRDSSAAGSISSRTVINFATSLADVTDQFAATRLLTGIAQYARDQIGDQGIDVVAEFTAMETAAIETRDWITANFPQDGSGYLLMVQFDVNGRQSIRTLAAAQTAGLRTELDALIATIS